MSEETSASAADGESDDALLRAVARAPVARARLAGVALPEPLRHAFADRAPDAQEACSDDLPQLGEVVDERYRIEARLGAGGMGVVFAATHLKTHKAVALKWMYAGPWLRSESDRIAGRRRFEREARIAARVRHPNLVDVYDASSDGSRAYLVMERLSGETLGARMKRGPLSYAELTSLLLPTLRGVAALHAQGVIHRDLKPENIFLARTGEGDELCPKVLDFGVASLREAEPTATDDTLTRPGSVIGTPGYMSLEQLRGARTLDARTDVFALGVIAYEALAGRRPFVAGNAAEHAALLASEAPPSLATLVPDLRGARASAIMRAIARDAGDRYETVREFADALQTAAVPSPWWRRRHVGRAALLAVLSVGVAWGWYARESPRQRAHGRRDEPAAAVERAVAQPIASESAVAASPTVVPEHTERAIEAPLSSPRVRPEPGPAAPADRAASHHAHDASRRKLGSHLARPAAAPVDRATRLSQDDF